MAAQQHEIDELVAHLRQADAPSVLVTGTRGSGKSTLMRGLRDALESAELPVTFHCTEEDFTYCHAEEVVERISKIGARKLRELGLKYRLVPQQTQFSNEPALPRFECKGGPLYIFIDGLDFIIDDNGFPLYNLAVLIGRKPERYAEAEQLYLELLAMLDRVSEDISLRKWKALETYAGHLENMFRKEDALARREEAIAAARQALGAGHPQVGELLLSLSCSIRWWKPDYALTCAEQGHAILQAAAGPRHSRATWGLRVIAFAHEMLGRFDQARAILERTLELGKAEARSSPYVAATALNELADAAEEAGDWQLGLRDREARLEHLRTFLGPRHIDTIRGAYGLARSCERNGERQRALELTEGCLRDYSAIGEATSFDRVDATLQVARMRLFGGDRGGCTSLVDELEKLAPGERPASCRIDFLLLKSELASMGGYNDERRRLVEEACQLLPMNYYDLQPQFGVVRAVLAGLLHLAGDADASLGQHEAGAQHLLLEQRHMLDFTLRPYETSLRYHVGPEDLARARIAELRLMFDTHIDSFGLAQFVLSPRPIRVAWNPKSPSILAALDGKGRSYLFDGHDTASMLEQLEPPFAPVEVPEDPALVSLNWSTSGEALRLRTPQGEKVNGRASDDEQWAPASAISPSGAYIAVMRRQSMRIVRARNRDEHQQ